jgi:hypothetical protein
MKRIFSAASLALTLTLAAAVHAQSPDCNSCHLSQGKNALPPVRQIQSETDRGYGVMDKGSLGNICGNFGILSNYHVFFQYAMHWPRWADDSHQYCFGFAPVVAVADNVVESYTSIAGRDWEAKDGGYGTQFSGDVRAASDDTPFLASSDIIDTWPMIGGERAWPGPFRGIPGNPDSATVPGQFASDRDVWGVFDDHDNQIQPLGLECRQMTYCYNRSYAEDFIFFDLKFHNTSTTTYDSLYIGHYGDFRVDYDNLDLLKLVDTDGDGKRDFLIYWDADEEPVEPWTVMGMIGVAIINTPDDIGVTDFHYFKHADRPTTDPMQWPIISGQPALAQARGMDPALFFHGADPRFDDPENVVSHFPPNPPQAPYGGAPLDYFLTTLLRDFAPGDSARLTLAVVMGLDSAALYDNLATAQLMASMGFQGSGPPDPPIVTFKASDHEATLYWDPNPSENSVDVITNELDFEGYKIYRSDDLGLTWGVEVRDYLGVLQGYVPLAIYDKIDGIQGADPSAPWQSLGSESGLQYSFEDSGLVNGVEYWYAVCAYDHGLQGTDPEPSLQNGFGRPEVSTHIISVTPGVNPQTYNPIPGGIFLPQMGMTMSGYVAPSGPLTLGTAFVEVIGDPDSLSGHGYRIAISDSMPHPDSSFTVQGTDTIWSYFTSWWDSTCYSVIDTTLGDTLIAFHPFFVENAGNSLAGEQPIVDGLRFTVKDGSLWFGWTLFHQDSCTFDWWREARQNPMGEAWIQGSASFRLTVDYDSLNGGCHAQIEDQFGGYYPAIWVPFRVEMISDTSNPIDVGDLTWIVDYETGVLGGTVPFPPNMFFSPAGWDLEPGGTGYNPFDFGNAYPDEISFRYYAPTGDTSIANIRTQNLPDSLGGIAPTQGDQFSLLNARLTSQHRFDFGTAWPTYTLDPTAVNLAQIKVVPNPYIVSAGWESGADDHRLQFTHLPPECTIEIYTVSGNLVRRLHHQSDTEGYLFWDLRNESKQDVAFGLYVFYVKTHQGQEHAGRFVVIR